MSPYFSVFPLLHETNVGAVVTESFSRTRRRVGRKEERGRERRRGETETEVRVIWRRVVKVKVQGRCINEKDGGRTDAEAR